MSSSKSARPADDPYQPAAASPPAAASRPAEAATGGLLVLLVILLVASNLRVAITSLGALLDEVRLGVGLTPTMLGVITALPTLAFAAFGALTPRLNRRFQPTTLLVAALGLLVLGQLLRAATSSVLFFFLASAAALAGIAVSNILLPVLVKRYFPHRLGVVTGFYTVAMIAGSTTAAAVSVPAAHLVGSWRGGLAAWAGLALVALVPVLLLRARPTGAAVPPADHRAIRPSRTRLGWAMAVLFGMQSFAGYAIMGWLPHVFSDAGFSAQTSGLLLALLIGTGLPFALLMPAIASRWTDQRPLLIGLGAASLVAYLGLALAPRSGVLVWIGLLAIGQGVFPLALYLIGVRARTHEGTVALSTFTQSAGYLFAAAGPLSVGLLYESTGGWSASFGVLIVALLIQLVAGLLVARPRILEDEILARRAPVPPITRPMGEFPTDSTVITLGEGLGDGSCRSAMRAKPARTSTVGATTGLTESVARRAPHAPRTRWNIGRHESPRPGGRR